MKPLTKNDLRDLGEFLPRLEKLYNGAALNAATKQMADQMETWARWIIANPRGRVITPPIGLRRDYTHSSWQRLTDRERRDILRRVSFRLTAADIASRKRDEAARRAPAFVPCAAGCGQLIPARSTYRAVVRYCGGTLAARNRSGRNRKPKCVTNRGA